MAMDYMTQAMGYGPDAFETEEERRKRLEAAGSMEVKSQTIKTFADGTQEAVTKQQIPSAGPVAPDSTYGRMLQVESGNKDFDAQGRPVTSPKGAMFASQVMPATAANPGFGIRPAAAQTPEEYNRVGQEYFQALLQKYNGDEQKAIAAYNMGPGAVDRNIAQNQGQFNVATAPQETQSYLRRVGERVLGAMVPSAQAATPVAPTATTQPARIVPPGQTVNLANSSQNIPVNAPPVTAPVNQAVPPQQFTTTPPTAEGLAMGPPVTAITAEAYGQIEPYAQGFIDAKSPQDLMRIGSDVNAPKWAQELAGQKLAQQLRGAEEKEKTTAELQQKITTGDTLGIAKMFQDKRGEGSWAKAILFGYMGAPQLAAAELGKMGYGTSFQQSMLDGKPVLLEMRFDGLPQQGVDLTTGIKLDDAQMARAVTGVVGKGGQTEAGLVDNATGVGGYTRTVTADGRQIIKDASGAIVTNPQIITNLRKVGVEGTRAEQDESARVKAAYSNLAKNFAQPTEQQKFKALQDAGVPPRRIEAELGLKPGTLSGAAAATTAPTATPTATDVKAATTTQQVVSSPRQAESVYEEPVQRPGESNTAFKARVEDRNKKLNLMNKNAEDFRTKSDDIKNQLQSLKNTYDIISRGEYNLGPVLGGGGAAYALPGAQQFFGELVGTEESQNTVKILSLINREGLQDIKNSMGPAISNFDVQTWMRSNPIKPNASQDALKDYVAKLYKEIYEKAERSRDNAVRLGMIEGDFSLGARPEEIRTSRDGEVDRDNPLLKKKK
jgi:hypothetical protein